MGFKNAGFEIILGVDNDIDSMKSYEYNFKSAHCISKDIKKVSKHDLNVGLGGKKVDVLIGGPPCQGFSNANRWQKNQNDPRNELFFEYLRFIKHMDPKIILMENVRGMISTKNGKVREKIESLFKGENYNISSTILDASEYGVPQKRKRAFFVGLNKDFFEDNQTFDFSKLKKRKVL